MSQVPAVLPVLPLLPVIVLQPRRRSASVWPDEAPPPSPPCPRRRRATMATPASLSPGPGRRAPPQHRCASALQAAAPARPGGGCSGAPARERPRSSRRRLRRSWRPRSRETWLGLGRRYLRNISRRLRKHRSVVVGKRGSPSSSSMAAAAVDDDTARERAEAVACAISYCKDTLRRSSMPPPPPPPPSSPSLVDWLDHRDRQDQVIVASAAEQRCDDCRAIRDSWPSPPTRPRRGRDAGGLPLVVQTRAKRFKELPCPALPSRKDGSLAATAVVVAHGEEASHHGHGSGCRGETTSSFDELEFLKTFDGDEEMINRHFITVEIPRSGSDQVFREQNPLDMKRKAVRDEKKKSCRRSILPTLNVVSQGLELEN